MGCHLFKTFIRNASPSGDIAKKRYDIVLAFWTAEGSEEDGVVGDRRNDVSR
jgi:hypothetical protein